MINKHGKLVEDHEGSYRREPYRVFRRFSLKVFSTKFVEKNFKTKIKKSKRKNVVTMIRFCFFSLSTEA